MAPDLNPSSAPTRVDVVGRLTPDQIEAVTQVVDEATEADGVGPLSEHVLLHLRYGGDEPARNLLLWHGSQPRCLRASRHDGSGRRPERGNGCLACNPASRLRSRDHHGRT